MTFKVYVDGQEGTTGLRINEYLARRSDVSVLKIDAALRKDVDARRAMINASDVTFLCLPDDAAKEAVALVDNANTCVIDASTAHRINPDWVFGLPELDPAVDRLMLCGGPSVLSDLKPLLESRGFIEGSLAQPGDYVLERAFVES